MLGNPGIYANKKRKKPVLKQKKPADSHEVVKSNPSKRHRDRLNGELDRLMELLPFQEEVRSRLDKLSVLRLCVGFLRVKSYFRATMKNGGRAPLSGNGNRDAVSEAELLLQALSGFLVVVTADGQVFYASPTIKEYLGFHQSDVVHQSVFELIHTDDRALFREQLHFALDPQPEGGQGPPPPLASYSPEQLPPENSSFLERSFVCRFRCLLDNSSGFLALKFQGRLKFLRGQGPSRGGRVQLALFAVATPVQTPSIVEIRAKMLLFQTRHKLDFTPTGVDSRGKIILGYTEAELCSKGSGYQFIHAADMMYCAENHIRMIKTGESGLTYLRLLSKSGSWLWVKSNARLVYRAGRPDFIIVHQRALTSSEGEESLRQRRLQLPFSGATGEAILYECGPAPPGPAPSELGPAPPDQGPASLLDCLLAQDQSAYSGPAESPLPVDQVFMDSRALVSFAAEAWSPGAVANGNANGADDDHARRALDAMMAGIEEDTENGELEAALQQLEAEDARRLEDAIRRLCQEGGALEGGGAPLDAIRTPCQEGGVLESGVQLDGVGLESGVQLERGGLERGGLESGVHFERGGLESGVHFESGGLESGVQLERGGLQSGVHFERGGLESGAQLDAILSGAVFDYIDSLFQEAPGAGFPPPELCEPLFRPGPNGAYGQAPPAMAGGGGRGQAAPGDLPPLQRLQLRDIFSPSIELPPLAVPDAVPPCQQNAAVGAPRQAPPTGRGVPGTIRDFGSSCTPPVYQQAPFPAFQGQTFPHGELWAPGHAPSPGPAPCPGPGPAPSQSSCMFQQHFPSGPAGGAVLGRDQWAGQPGGGGASGGGAPPPTELHANMQHYLDGGSQSGPAFVAPPLDVAAYLME